MKTTIKMFKEFFSQKIEKNEKSIEQTNRQIQEIKDNVKDTKSTVCDNFPNASELITKYNLSSLINEFNLFRSIASYTYDGIIAILEMKKTLDSIDTLNTKSCLKGDLDKLFETLDSLMKIHNCDELNEFLENQPKHKLYLLQHIEFKILLVLREILKNTSKKKQINLTRYCQKIKNSLSELYSLVE